MTQSAKGAPRSVSALDGAREFEGQVALVTGGARGIGRACCLRLAAGGAKVALTYRENAAAAEATRAEIREAGGEAEIFRADVGDETAMQEAVAAARQSLGPIGLLVANAGAMQLRGHAELTLADWRETLRVNLDGPFISIQAVKDQMLERGEGAVVCVSSIAALRPRGLQIDYAAAKAGVVGMMRSFAEALGPAVRVNAVAPGLTDTDMIRQIDPAVFDARIAVTPLKRLAFVEDVAEAAAYLLSRRSAFITGQTLVVSGGDVMAP